MKPDTLKIFTDLAIEKIKDEMKELADLCDADDIDSASCRDIAETGQTIADIAAALVNLYLTVADEIDRIIADRIESLVIKGVDLAVEPVGILSSEEGEAGNATPENIKLMTQQEHIEAHQYP